MYAKLLVLLAVAGLATAQGPNDPGFYNTVAEIHSGPDCLESNLVWLDPIFGRGNMCQPLDRNNNTPDIISYKVTYNYEGCSGESVFFLLEPRARGGMGA
ncbi:hypothetical protein K469DRAFT_716064 [Zopfia rhizophila CBS 207.26]|uniref:Lytic polysaccharide monooxygenase n=1 Tax=Zopfia rhizophila CBS 207.26 TaxID=1314779 RepID=A0A6A6DJM3_9PEZI|nr:hypothetical protein K469DRAFT_716064 [Zopfia rhizophila CBS 207.26]